LLLVLLAPIAAAALVGVAVLYPWGDQDPPAHHAVGEPVDGVIVTAATGPCLSPGQVQVGEPAPDDERCLTVEIALSEGPAEQPTITKTVPLEPSTPRFAVD